MIEIITYIASQLVDIETNGKPHIAKPCTQHNIMPMSYMQLANAESSRGDHKNQTFIEFSDQTQNYYCIM